MQIKYYIMLTITSFTLQLTPALAGENLGEECKNPKTQSRMNECAAIDYNNSAAHLHSINEKLIAALAKYPKRQSMFKKAQSAWQSYKNYECKLAAAGVGTIGGTLENTCQTKLINQRIKVLEGYLNCPEGETACVIPR